MDRDIFIKTINTLIELFKFRGDMHDLIRNLKCVDTDFIGEDSVILPAESLIIELISLAITHKKEKAAYVEELIGWWLFDCELGTERTVVTYGDGSTLDVNSPEMLWEFIQQEIS